MIIAVFPPTPYNVTHIQKTRANTNKKINRQPYAAKHYDPTQSTRVKDSPTNQNPTMQVKAEKEKRKKEEKRTSWLLEGF